jgi:hypothetical protein
MEKWAGQDLNLRSLSTTDLQSVPFSLSGTDPFKSLKFKTKNLKPNQQPTPTYADFLPLAGFAGRGLWILLETLFSLGELRIRQLIRR